MRETYDTIVIGDGPAACLYAKSVADGGGNVAMLGFPHGIRLDASDWIDYWLVDLDDAPLWLLAPLGLDGLSLETMARVVEVADIDVPGHDRPNKRAALVAVEDLRQRLQAGLENAVGIDRLDRFAMSQYLYEGDRVVGVRATSRRGEVRHLHSPLVADTTRSCARVDVRPSEFGLFDAVVWGRYHGVCREPGPRGATAITLKGRQGARFWVLPISDVETHLGVEIQAQPAGRLISPAQLWEDELVGCHPMAQRLMNARLMESCQLQRACYPHGPGVSQPGLVCLEDLAAPSPLAFRWPVLQQAVDQAEYALRDPRARRQLAGG